MLSTKQNRKLSCACKRKTAIHTTNLRNNSPAYWSWVYVYIPPPSPERQTHCRKRRRCFRCNRAPTSRRGLRSRDNFIPPKFGARLCLSSPRRFLCNLICALWSFNQVVMANGKMVSSRVYTRYFLRDYFKAALRYICVFFFQETFF